ncbi:MAG TPA: glycosyltransferase family 39 protein [Azospirillaceae bacterium]|nr:glycosyltransferase family 39 protein [Azospirillaceae bacterium]
MMRLPPVPRLARRLLPALCIALFLALAAAHLGRPGLYGDEVIFAPISYVILGAGDLQAAIASDIAGWPFRQHPFYVGLLKPYLHAPILAAFGASPLTLRLPMILVGALCLALTWRFARARLGGFWAGVLLVLAATDPAFVYHVRIDWGPVAFSILFKLLALGSLVRFTETRRTRDLALLVLWLALGFYDKSSFLFFVAALGAAGLAVHGDALLAYARARPAHAAIVLPGAAALFAAMTAAWVLPAMEAVPSTSAHAGLGFAERLASTWGIYLYTMSGQAVRAWTTGELMAVQPVHPLLIVPQLLATAAVAVRGAARRRLAAEERWLVLSGLLTVLVFVQLAASRHVGGSHHAMMIWPLHLINLVLCGVVAERALTDGARRRVRASAALLAAMVTATHLWVGLLTLRSFIADGPFRPGFSPAVYDLARAVRERGAAADAIHVVDWSIQEPLVTLIGPELSRRVRGFWPILEGYREPRADADEWLFQSFLGDRLTLAVMAAPGRSLLPPNSDAFMALVGRLRLCVADRTVLEGPDGTPEYVLLVLDGRAETCPGASATAAWQGR